MKKSVVILGLCAAATLLAQGPPAGRGRGPMGPGPGMMGFPGGPGMNKTVTGAPFSGVEVRESSQTLANGNVITQKTQSNVYRDGMGRFRTEMTVPGRRGPGQAATGTPAGQSHTIVNIHDPVAGVSRELDAEAKTARETALPTRNGNPPADRPGRGGPRPALQSDPNVVTEQLAMQTINGVQATGVRVTRTIPTGEIGNAQPIQVVNETWTSVDLKLAVMTKHTDPRMGTTTVQLTNIVRSEPDPALFQAPADYTVTKGHAFPGRGPAGVRQ